MQMRFVRSMVVGRADHGAWLAAGPGRLLREVPARLHAEVVAKGDVVHRLAALEHQVRAASEQPARRAPAPLNLQPEDMLHSSCSCARLSLH